MPQYWACKYQTFSNENVKSIFMHMTWMFQTRLEIHESLTTRFLNRTNFLKNQ